MPKREMKIAIYSRVSMNSAEQLKSLVAQVSAFTRLTASTEAYQAVQIEKSKRSNVTANDGTQRKDRKYSSKMKY